LTIEVTFVALKLNVHDNNNKGWPRLLAYTQEIVANCSSLVFKAQDALKSY